MAHIKHIKGDRAELIAAEYFMSLGYSVHRNMSQHGPVDRRWQRRNDFS